ncbi:MAG: hypothetical protein ACLS5R_03780 [Blautia sp.]
MFGEGHAHLFMNGYDYRKAVETHKGHIREDILRGYLEEYRRGLHLSETEEIIWAFLLL